MSLGVGRSNLDILCHWGWVVVISKLAHDSSLMVSKTIKTGIWVHAFILQICISNYANMTSSFLHRQISESSIFISKLPSM
jgi:hypothetical protein